MAFPQGIDFRATSGFVTDPANCDYEIGTTANYPRTTAQGNSVGWEDAPGGTRNRNAAVDARVAGLHFNGTSILVATRYRIDLPSAGNYKFRAAAGDTSNPSTVELELFDDVTSLGNLVTRHTAITSGSFYDATDVQRANAADWVTNNALSPSYTFASTICRVKLGLMFATQGCCVAHLWIEAAGGGGGITGPLVGMGHLGGGGPLLGRLVRDRIRGHAENSAIYRPTLAESLNYRNAA